MFLEGFGEEVVGGPVEELNLVVHAFLRFQNGGADVGEGGGAFGRDAIGGEKREEIAEDVVDVDLSEVVAGRGGEFGGEILLTGIGLRPGIDGDDWGVHFLALDRIREAGVFGTGMREEVAEELVYLS